MIRRLVFRSWLLALGLGLAAPLPAQTADPLAAAREAEARLDFTAALDTLGRAIDAAPADPAPRLARAALHRKMNRPSLALADLSAVLADDPGNRDAHLARGALLDEIGAVSEAIRDFDAVLDRAPGDVEALVGRARARARSGLVRLALEDYDAALSNAPDRDDIAAERAALTRPATPRLVFDPAALMDPAFRVTEGAEGAATDLIIVHAGNDLAREQAGLARAAFRPALEAGALRLTHLFTYTGQDSAIWANLALICAGPAGFDATWQALAGPDGQAALADLEAGRGRGTLEALVTAAYDTAGLAPETGPDCAFSRAKAVAYLADWSQASEAPTGSGPTIYDAWPVYVLDGRVVSADALRARLDALAPALDEPDVAMLAEPVAPAPEAPDGAAVPDSAGGADDMPAAGEVAAPEPAEPVDPASDEPDAAAPESTGGEPDLSAPGAAQVPEPSEPVSNAAEVPDSDAVESPELVDPVAPASEEPGVADPADAPVGLAQVSEPDAPVAPTAEEPDIAAAQDLTVGASGTPEPGAVQVPEPAAPAPATSEEPGVFAAQDPTVGAEVPAASDSGDAPESGDASDPDTDTAEDLATTETPTATDAPPAAETPPAPRPADAVPPPLPPAFGPVDAAARIPPELKGVWAPGLVGCIAYTDAIAEPEGLDAALPALNPLDGPPVGTVLVTSRNMLLFNAVGTACDLVSVSDGEDGAWTARLACRTPVAPSLAVPMTLTRRDGDGPAPRLDVDFGSQARQELVQCRPLGLLGQDFAALWEVDATACRATAPLTDARFVVSASEGEAQLRITPDAPPEDAGALTLTVDGEALGGSGTWADGAWQVPLGPFADAAEALAMGLLLEARSDDGTGATAWARTLPLLGSGRAMDGLAACAGN